MTTPLVDLRLAPDARAPYIARRVIVAVTSETPSIRTVDVSLMTSELVTACVASDAVISLTVTEEGRALRVAVASGAGMVDEIVTMLLDRLATRWGDDEGGAWFEVDLVRRRALDSLNESELWSLLPDHDARSELFDRFLGFSTALARRFTRSRVAFDDLEQVAAMALVKALDRFDPDYGVRFTTYAAETIKGEMKRHMRDSAWSMRVPRGLKEASLRVRRGENELSQELGREPTVEELAAATDLTVAEVREAIQASQAYTAMSLDAPRGGEEEDGLSLAAVLGVEDAALERAEAWHAVEAAMNQLDDRERQILYLRFFEDMSQSEIAEVVGVSQMHVSRLLARSISDIRTLVGAE